MNKNNFALGLAGVAIVLAVGIGFFVNFQVKLYKAVVLQGKQLSELQTKVSIIDNFIGETFREQVDAYIKSKTLPATNKTP